MSNVNPAAPEFADAISFESVLIETELVSPVEIAPLVTDLDVFEHLDKPYVTAVLGFLDVENVVADLNISGGERVSIVLKTNLQTSIPIRKIFYIDKIMSASKTHSNEEFFTLHLIEDHAFISNTLNVNKAYSGSTTTIVSKIAKDFLDTNIDILSSDVHNTKVIVPNLTPIDAMCWVKNRTTTTTGYPFYLFSNFIDLNLQFDDLQSMMSSAVMNPDAPYTYYEAQMASNADTLRRRVILSYQARDTYDIYRLIDEGLLGSEYQYVDVTKPKHDGSGKRTDHKFTFDIDKEVISKMTSDGIIQNIPLYDSTRYDWSKKKVNSRKITRMGSSNIFNDIKSLSEREEVAQYRLNEVSRAMSQLLTTDAMTFMVNGLDFFSGESNATIGNKIRIQFLKNRVDEYEGKFDTKKSGDYLIFACKHSISPSEYTLTFSGVKLSNGDIV